MHIYIYICKSTQNKNKHANNKIANKTRRIKQMKQTTVKQKTNEATKQRSKQKTNEVKNHKQHKSDK